MKTPRMICLVGSMLATLLIPSPGLADPPWYTFPRPEPLTPLPTVALAEAVTVGTDVGVTIDWPITGEPLPPGARLRLLDGEGLTAGLVQFEPVYGPQTLWFSGGALPRPADTSVWPLLRYVELVAAPSNDILLESGLAVGQIGPAQPVVSRPRRPQTTPMGRICVLRLDYMDLIDSEDESGDDLYMYVGGTTLEWRDDDLKGPQQLPMNWSFALCDTCRNFERSFKIELWDEDDPVLLFDDPDDLLGSTTVSGCYTTPWQTANFSGKTWNYNLVYQVFCTEVPCT